MALTVRPVQRSRSNASGLKVIRSGISCGAEVNTFDKSTALTAYVRIHFDMRRTVSLPPSPNFRENRRKPVELHFDSDTSPLFLSDYEKSAEDDLSSGYGSCDSALGSDFVSETDFIFPMTPRPRAATEGIFPAAESTAVTKRRWGSSSSTSSSSSFEEIQEEPTEEVLVESRIPVRVFLSMWVMLLKTLDAVWDKRWQIHPTILRILRYLQPTIIQRLTSDKAFSSLEEDLGFGMESGDSDIGDLNDGMKVNEREGKGMSASAESDTWLQSVVQYGRRWLKVVDTVDVFGWLTRAKSFAVDHPIFTCGAGAVACTVAVPAFIAIACVSVCLGIGFVGFLFVEGTLLTMAALFVGTILLALGLVVLTIGVSIFTVWFGASNAYGALIAAVAFVRERRNSDASDRRALRAAHHHHVHRHHAPTRHSHRHLNGFVPNPVPPLAEGVREEEDLVANDER
ncbi:unnamed protein product [Notodromas monacha]|uniref:Transmembrane protein n=1 Tax=Notodromas monacha TaxID=399045 RepID=A0A7R9GI74_9CRUS|nr:unnamed protein product [Notodromas monacha]CAG0922292.1 unnamed protein product [Notodromas monacha]